MTDLSQARIPLYNHQIVGTESLIRWDNQEAGRVFGGCFGLFDEMGAGKTKQAIDAAQALYQQGEIDTVLVVAPSSVRPVWFDQELGELAKHLWLSCPSIVTEYRPKIRQWHHGKTAGPALVWIITNYEFIRGNEDRLEYMESFCTKKTLLVLDESSAIKSHRAKQTKACYRLRKKCGRIVILNGTPVSNSPADLYSQMHMLHPKILDCKNFFIFRAKYAVMGGFMKKQVVSWNNLEEIQQKVAPYVLRRLKIDCLDLPPKLPPVILTATLTKETWKLYKELRDELCAWLDQQTVVSTPQAAVKAMRLAQITSGFLGGLQTQYEDEEEHEATPPREISREKLDLLLEWIDEQIVIDPNFKLLVWSRFRPEVGRLSQILIEKKQATIGLIWGGQKREERGESLRLLDPRTTPPGPVIVCGISAAGAMGLNLAAAHDVVYISNSYSLMTRLQSMDRVHRPGQVFPVSYFDIVATGPSGQKTVDHLVVKALRTKEDLATWTTKAWVQALREE